MSDKPASQYGLVNRVSASVDAQAKPDETTPAAARLRTAKVVSTLLKFAQGKRRRNEREEKAIIVAEPPFMHIAPIIGMLDPPRHDFKQIIAEIETVMTRHTLAKMLRRQHTQVARIAESGRCQHYDGEMLLMIHQRYVASRGTLQNVTTSATLATT